MKHGHLYQCGLELMNCTASIPSQPLPNPDPQRRRDAKKTKCCPAATVARQGHSVVPCSRCGELLGLDLLKLLHRQTALVELVELLLPSLVFRILSANVPGALCDLLWECGAAQSYLLLFLVLRSGFDDC